VNRVVPRLGGRDSAELRWRGTMGGEGNDEELGKSDVKAEWRVKDGEVVTRFGHDATGNNSSR
jgi:hypothetical protein